MKGTGTSLNIEKALIYLLFIFLPVQLGRHFSFDFSSIAGIKSDYLTPTLYFTDILVLALIFIDLKRLDFDLKKWQDIFKRKRGVILFFIYILLVTVFIAGNKGAAFYLFLRLVEFFWLFEIIVRAKLNLLSILPFYAIGIIYTSYLSIGQFLGQRSLGGWWWFLGERTFSSSTPGIALASVYGRLFLRPYGSFPHPNLLGGYLALGLPLILFYLLKEEGLRFWKKLLFTISFILGSVVLVLTFSRAAWSVFMIGLVYLMLLRFENVRNLIISLKRYYLSGFFILLAISFIWPLFFGKSLGEAQRSLFERSRLIYASLTVIKENFLLGTGLGNSEGLSYKILPKKYGLLIMQPVHNIYLLIWAELGIVGFIFMVLAIKKIFEKIKKDSLVSFWSVLTLFLLGFFDHYLITLQQGMLLTVLFIGIFWQQDRILVNPNQNKRRKRRRK